MKVDVPPLSSTMGGRARVRAGSGVKLRSGGALEDVAPTLLGLLGLEQPSEMTGKDLREI